MTEIFDKLNETREYAQALEREGQHEQAQALFEKADSLEPNILTLEIFAIQDEVDRLAPTTDNEERVRELDQQLDDLDDRMREISVQN